MNNIATFSERLIEALQNKRMTAADLARYIGVNEGTISNYKKGAYEPKQRRTEEIANALNVSIAWLMGSDVPMERDPPALTPPTIIDTVTFPVIGEIAAGYEHIAIEDWSGDTIEIPKSYLRGRDKSDYFVLSVSGGSMYPMYLSGDKVLILKQPTLNRSGDVGAIVYDGEYATLKRIEYVEGEEWLKMIPINPEYEPKEITGADLEQCRILGIPTVLVREL